MFDSFSAPNYYYEEERNKFTLSSLDSKPVLEGCPTPFFFDEFCVSFFLLSCLISTKNGKNSLDDKIAARKNDCDLKDLNFQRFIRNNGNQFDSIDAHDGDGDINDNNLNHVDNNNNNDNNNNSNYCNDGNGNDEGHNNNNTNDGYANNDSGNDDDNNDGSDNDDDSNNNDEDENAEEEEEEEEEEGEDKECSHESGGEAFESSTNNGSASFDATTNKEDNDSCVVGAAFEATTKDNDSAWGDEGGGAFDLPTSGNDNEWSDGGGAFNNPPKNNDDESGDGSGVFDKLPNSNDNEWDDSGGAFGEPNNDNVDEWGNGGGTFDNDNDDWGDGSGAFDTPAHDNDEWGDIGGAFDIPANDNNDEWGDGGGTFSTPRKDHDEWGDDGGAFDAPADNNNHEWGDNGGAFGDDDWGDDAFKENVNVATTNGGGNDWDWGDDANNNYASNSAPEKKIETPQMSILMQKILKLNDEDINNIEDIKNFYFSDLGRLLFVNEREVVNKEFQEIQKRKKLAASGDNNVCNLDDKVWKKIIIENIEQSPAHRVRTVMRSGSTNNRRNHHHHHQQERREFGKRALLALGIDLAQQQQQLEYSQQQEKEHEEYKQQKQQLKQQQQQQKQQQQRQKQEEGIKTDELKNIAKVEAKPPLEEEEPEPLTCTASVRRFEEKENLMNVSLSQLEALRRQLEADMATSLAIDSSLQHVSASLSHENDIKTSVIGTLLLVIQKQKVKGNESKLTNIPYYTSQKASSLAKLQTALDCYLAGIVAASNSNSPNSIDLSHIFADYLSSL